MESELLLSSLDQALQSDSLSIQGDRASVRSRQSSIARSNESLDSAVSQQAFPPDLERFHLKPFFA